MLYRPYTDPASRSATRVVFAVLCAHLSSASASCSTAWPTLPGSQCASAVRELTAVPTCLLVDANNVRGATAFRLTTGALVDLAEAWAHSNGLRGRVHLVWDHGCKPDALTSRGLEHGFAGPRQSADDMIAAQVPLLLKGGERVCVVTTDRELIFRAKHAAASSGAGRGALRLLGTRKFVAMLRHGREAAECAQEEASRFAIAQRASRWHERRRRKHARKSGAAPFAERTWQRVLLAERLRRAIRTREGGVANSGDPTAERSSLLRFAAAVGEDGEAAAEEAPPALIAGDPHRLATPRECGEWVRERQLESLERWLSHAGDVAQGLGAP
ncbi:hypothetical protein EMIHUDRAFT_236466 [Emiliania huxleyi CCMP1516]|uniref:NYN domain-containing protein n=2 Tax=Emiliania huxleyi TaxID=2903 RepID=A0A0D3JTF8_EMIH1|nr:hypothetical protein EMIHUDRAFT_236466 [Emiliania huxleyi CCMP1516]EOD26793.1 hypothetical protein EMIHUDRAFT_236466 [Emiliania huxleyi CCMP1516]|eukprot:XP_005779222.1 hypothetical protein EMIHUDRAFT_236466 [Emiliania huxleyi CCMP1516]